MSALNLTRTCRRIASSSRSSISHWRARQGASPLNLRLTHSVAPNLTPVEKIILDHIKTTGPIPFSTYMQLCLSHPTHGYYMNSAHKVFGSGGDFITSPDISQMFGELVALWLLSQYSVLKVPFRIVELGPGRGTLMDDILRVCRPLISQHAPFHKTINVHLVETSPTMRALQEAKLNSNMDIKVQLHWHNSLSEIPPSPSEFTFLVAHEFFDALPIHVIQKTEAGWHEVLIAANTEDSPQTDGRSEVSNSSAPSPSPAPPTSPTLCRVLASKPSAASTLLGHSSPRFQNLPTGSTLEVSPAAFRIARKVGELLHSGSPDDEKPSMGGCGLIIDYGGDRAFGDSFRAFKEHKIVDVFHQPGNCDLTANVDFAYLKEAMSDLVATYGPISQGSFLERMGIQLRLQGLLKAAKSEERGDQLREAAKRLVDPMGMGKEYQVMGITSKLPEGTHVWPFVEEK